MQDFTNTVSLSSVYCMQDIQFLCEVLLFSHVRSNRSSPSFFSTTLRNFQCISDLREIIVLFVEVFKGIIYDSVHSNLQFCLPNIVEIKITQFVAT